MKNIYRKVAIAVCAVLLLQGGSFSHAGPIQRLRTGISNLRCALACVNSNSCSPDQQKYVKSLVTKLAVATAAAAVACGVYATFKSIAAPSDLTDIFGITEEKDMAFLKDLQKFGLLVKAGKRAEAVALSNELSNRLLDVSLRGVLAVEYMHKIV